MDPLTLAMIGSAAGGLISGVGGLLSGNKQSGANMQAAAMSMMMQQQALQQAQNNYNQASALLSPYATSGSKSMQLLQKYLTGGAEKIGGGGSSLISTFAPTMAQLESTPGYQFALDQGTKAAQNSAAARGLGSSGNAVMGGINYATGLATTTFQQQLENYLKQNQQAFNMLFSPAQLGAGAASANMQGTSNFNNVLTGTAQNMGQTAAGGIMGAANAQAGGINALAGGVGSAISTASQYPWRNQIYGNNNNNNPNAAFGLGSPAFAPNSIYHNPLAGLQPQAEWAQPYSL